MIRLSRSTAILALVAGVAMFRLDLMATLAHGGHEHHEGGFQFGGIVDVGVTVGVLVMAYILATWVLRYRDQSARKPTASDGQGDTG